MALGILVNINNLETIEYNYMTYNSLLFIFIISFFFIKVKSYLLEEKLVKPFSNLGFRCFQLRPAGAAL